MLVSVAARGNSSSSSAPKQEGDVKEITVWAWGPTLTQVAKDFKKETGINVNLVNTGQGNKTWDEFYQDAKKIHALGDNYYITSDTGVAGFYDSMTWLASATLFSTEGETVTINLTGAPKVKARGIFGDYLGKSYTGNQKLSDGVAALGTGSEGLREGSGLHRQVTFAVKQSGVVMTGIR